MLFSKMERDYFKRVLKDTFPEIYRFVAEGGVISFSDVQRLVGDIKRVDSPTAVSKAVAFASGRKDGTKNRRVALCPAGGFYREILSHCEREQIEIVGFFDSYKAQQSDRFEGYPLFGVGDLNQEEYDALILLSSAYADEIYDIIMERFPDMEDRIFVPFLMHPLNNEKVETEIKKIEEIFTHSPHRMTVVIAVEGLYVNFLKRIAYLKENGVCVVLMTLSDKVSHAFPLRDIEPYFDHISYFGTDRFSFLRVIQAIRPDIIHLMPGFEYYAFNTLIRQVSRVPVICEFIDILFSMHTLQTMSNICGEKEARLRFESEKHLCRESNGIIYKNSASAYAGLKAHYGITAPSLQFQAYIPAKEAIEKKEISRGSKRIVYAGGVFSKGIYEQNQTFSLYNVIDILTGQGFCFDIYNVYDTNDGEFDRFKQRAESNDRFGYHLPVENKRMTSTLSGYDYGWLVEDLPEGLVKEGHLKSVVTTKFFDYLAAGLPVIISIEFDYMAEIVDRYGIGIPVRWEDIYSLNEIVGAYDSEMLLENIREFQKQWSMEGNIGRLTAFYRQIIASRIPEY